ncbi:hypothetical protein [Luteolibacter marinus]|uniref:hypothetical protein n=1 Tax=Luteolibacter marinus TaxID=2776705 RepID=UPI0018663B26|nr:hypothetical protein [Luteolibacter marinus]
MRFLALLAIPLAAADPLPREILPAKATLEVQADRGTRKVWNTRFFSIDSDVSLTANELQRLAQVADTTALAVKAHPLPLFSPPRGKRSAISIHADPRSYAAAGGFPGTAGFYHPRSASVLLQARYLVPWLDPRADRRAFGNRANEELLVHEIVHLCMHEVNSKMPQWLLEGIADYYASAHEGGGRFNFADMDRSLRLHLRSQLFPDEPRIKLVPVKEVIGLDSREWLRYVSDLPDDERRQAYATSLLLAHYYLHGGDRRLAEVRAALEAEPRRRHIARLIEPDAAPAIQKSLVKYWKPKGLTLEFADRD